jgi:hypothetical protein
VSLNGFPDMRGILLLTYNRVLESLKAGKRLPETPFISLPLTAKGQKSVYSMFKKTDSTDSEELA